MQALTIGLQDELIALEAVRVREILDPVPITAVPHAGEFVGGLINVRGNVVPLADLRVMFGMERAAMNGDTRIVVMEIDIDDEPVMVGVLAEKVRDVADIEAGSIEDAPKVGMRWPAEFVRGIGRRGEDFIIIPDLERIFAAGTEQAAA
ncbi:chemotaxis protein CheW [Fulvimarina endophytica]|uniref:Chemotaxis protein CheW n=2 Tax=Fulvimarina endophytica TaxID=2293836 RepID=A0A371X0B8_9HYPH|nr:chemotaxis protein CheW [Fulvimarina endophytica]